jgi:hypothetical protein
MRSLLEKIQVIIDIFEQKPSQEIMNTFSEKNRLLETWILHVFLPIMNELGYP